MELIQGTAYTELGATATDDRDATVSVAVSRSVDVDTVGAYTITYSATDSANANELSKKPVKSQSKLIKRKSMKC
ncbi:MAG: DUF5011 domain-containing protein [Sulfurovum sp.]|nr:DUF5011 domain-containing protein [Sulfurovum sp.]